MTESKFKRELKEKGRTVLCKPNSCCPVITKDLENITITDDFGGKVKFTHEQWEMLGTIFRD